MRLGGYARTREPWWSGSSGRKAIILAVVLVIQAGYILWIVPTDAQAPPQTKMVEVVSYYDIAPLSGPEAAQLMAPESSAPDADSATAPAATDR